MIAISRSLRKKTTNADYDWTQFDASDYIEDTYHACGIIPEDQIHTKFFIKSVLKIPELSARLGTARSALDICAGGVPRNAALTFPLLHRTGRIFLADLEEPQIEVTRRTIERASQGELDGWARHQSDMEQHHPLWRQAISRACQRSEARKMNIFDLPKRSFDIITTGYGPESLTSDPLEYELAVNCWLDSGISDAIALMTYVQGSNGYMNREKFFPAVCVQPEDVERIVRRKLIVVAHYVAPNSGMMRHPEDPTTYEGLGMLIGIVRHRPASKHTFSV